MSALYQVHLNILIKISTRHYADFIEIGNSLSSILSASKHS